MCCFCTIKRIKLFTSFKPFYKVSNLLQRAAAASDESQIRVSPPTEDELFIKIILLCFLYFLSLTDCFDN